jgi:hypothetical protein
MHFFTSSALIKTDDGFIEKGTALCRGGAPMPGLPFPPDGVIREGIRFPFASGTAKM